MDHDELMHAEWEAWKDLVKRLKAVGAVTEEDCQSKISEKDTRGQALFHAIRLWGERLVALRQAGAWPKYQEIPQAPELERQ